MSSGGNHTRPHATLVKEIRLACGKDPDLVLFPVSPSAPGSQVRTAPVGITDLMGILRIGEYGLAIYVEVKTGRAKLNPDQEQFKALVLSRRAIHVTARSVADVLEALTWARLRFRHLRRRAA